MEEGHHVRFDTAVINDELHDNTIIYKVDANANSITIHLGFLQFKHKYQIELNIPALVVSKSVGNNYDFVMDESKLPNINCKLLEFSTKPIKDIEGNNHFNAKVEFFAHKEKFIKEHLSICGKQDPAAKLQLVLVARVLGRGKGTPMLRDSIHLIAVDDDEDSELSDWQGFPKHK